MEGCNLQLYKYQEMAIELIAEVKSENPALSQRELTDKVVSVLERELPISWSQNEYEGCCDFVNRVISSY